MSRLQLVHKGPRHENKAHEDFSLAVEPAASEEINFPPTSEDKALARHKPSLRGLERKKGKKNKKRNGSSNSSRMLCLYLSPPQKNARLSWRAVLHDPSVSTQVLTAIGKGAWHPPSLATQEATLQISHSTIKKRSRTSIRGGREKVINWELYVPQICNQDLFFLPTPLFFPCSLSKPGWKKRYSIIKLLNKQ